MTTITPQTHAIQMTNLALSALGNILYMQLTSEQQDMLNKADALLNKLRYDLEPARQVDIGGLVKAYAANDYKL